MDTINASPHIFFTAFLLRFFHWPQFLSSAGTLRISCKIGKDVGLSSSFERLWSKLQGDACLVVRGMEKKSRENGAAVLGLASVMAFLFVFGLLFDASLLRLKKYQLQVATDIGVTSGTLSRLRGKPASVVQDQVQVALRGALEGMGAVVRDLELRVRAESSGSVATQVSVESKARASNWFTSMFSGSGSSDLTAYSRAYTPIVNMGLVLDMSGSMQSTDGLTTTRMERAQMAVLGSGVYLRPSSDRLSIVGFASDVSVLMPFRSGLGYSRRDLEQVAFEVEASGYSRVESANILSYFQFQRGFQPPPSGVQEENMRVFITDGLGHGSVIKLDPRLINTDIIPKTLGNSYYYSVRSWQTIWSEGQAEINRQRTPDPRRPTNYMAYLMHHPVNSDFYPSCYERLRDPLSGVWVTMEQGMSRGCIYPTARFYPEFPDDEYRLQCSLNMDRDCRDANDNFVCCMRRYINALEPSGSRISPRNLDVTSDNLRKLHYASGVAHSDDLRVQKGVRTFAIGLADRKEILERMTYDERCLQHPIPYTDPDLSLVKHCSLTPRAVGHGFTLYPDADSLVEAYSIILSTIKIRWQN